METKRTQFLQIVGNVLLALILGFSYFLLGLALILNMADKITVKIFDWCEDRISYKRWRWLQKGIDKLCDVCDAIK